MSLLSTITGIGQKVATGVYNTVNKIGSTIASIGKQPAAATMSFPVSSPGVISAAQNQKVAKDVSTFNSIYPSGSVAPYNFNPVTGGGNIVNAEKTGQSGSSGTKSSNNIRTGSSTSSTAFTAPSTLNSQTFGGTNGGSSSNSSINFPSQNVVNASGALASTQAGNSQNTYSDGTPIEYDPQTGLPVKGQQQDQSSKFFDQYLQKLQDTPPPNYSDLYAKAEQQSGVNDQRQQVNNYQAQLNAITAKSEADVLATTGQNRGVPESIILGQQAEIRKEAAIQALPISAQLAAAQGNLALAEQHLQTRYDLLKQDAQNNYEYQTNIVKATYEFATAEEKKRLDAIQKQNDRTYAEHQKFIDTQHQLLLSATTQGAPAAVKSAILSAQSVPEVIAAAGAYGAKIDTSTNTTADVGSALSEAQSAIAKGADPTAVRQAFLKDHPKDATQWDNYFTNAQGQANVYPAPATPSTKPWWQFWN